MLRTALAALALALATPALAGPGTVDVKEAKAEMKAAKKYSKSVDKAVDKWQKGYDKGSDKKMAKADADLQGIIGDELLRLRREGVPTNKPEPKARPEPTRIVDGEKVLLKDLVGESRVYRLDYLRWQAATAPPPPEFPAKEAFRDDLVVLRDITNAAERGKAGKADLKRKNRLLEQLDRKVEGRYERADARYHKAKG
jgi:hypothetical protein